MRRPIELGNGVSITQPFGVDPDTYRQFGLSAHHGCDYGAPIGTPIYAPEAGTITISSNGATDQYTGRAVAGETIVLKGADHEHWFMHLNSRIVAAGNSVVEGQHIGYSGNTGFTTGPHLHWGIRPNQPDINNGYRGFINPAHVLNKPAPTPPAPAPPAVVKEFVDIPAKQIVINRGTHRWNVAYDDFNGMSSHPVEPLNEGAGPYTVSVRVDHKGVGYSYYLENRNNLGGFNVLDCSDYVAPEPVIEPEKPKQWPTAPATAGDTTPYNVVKLLDGYETSNKAANRIGLPVAPVGAGQYFVFNKRYADNDPSRMVAINVTTKLGQPGYWINVEDNVPDPEPVPEPTPEPPKIDLNLGNWTDPRVEPEPTTPDLPTTTPIVVTRPNWRSTYTTFKDSNGHDEQRLYIAMKDFDMVDQESTNRTAKVRNNDHIWMSGTFLGPDDKLYGMPTECRQDKAGNKRYLYYGCPMDRDYVRTEQEVYNTTTTRKEREVIKVIQDVRVLNNKEKNRQHALNLVDWLTITPKEMETFVGKFMDFITGRPKKTKVPINKETK